MIVAFYLVSVVAVTLAVLAVTSSNLVRSALALAFCFFSLAGIFWLLGSPFLAMLQLVVNAGAIPIVTIFLVMMTHSRMSTLRNLPSAVWALFVAVPLALAVFAFLPPLPAAFAPTPLSVERLGVELLSTRGAEIIGEEGVFTVRGGTLIAFEATALVLLVAFVGSVVLAKREDTTVRSRPTVERRELVDADA